MPRVVKSERRVTASVDRLVTAEKVGPGKGRGPVVVCRCWSDLLLRNWGSVQLQNIVHRNVGVSAAGWLLKAEPYFF